MKFEEGIACIEPFRTTIFRMRDLWKAPNSRYPWAMAMWARMCGWIARERCICFFQDRFLDGTESPGENRHFSLALSPNPFAEGARFTLCLADGMLRIQAEKASVSLYADANAPCVRLLAEADAPLAARLEVHNYRNRPLHFSYTNAYQYSARKCGRTMRKRGSRVRRAWRCGGLPPQQRQLLSGHASHAGHGGFCGGTGRIRWMAAFLA